MTTQDIIDHILYNLLDRGIIVYVNQILISSNNQADHDSCVKEILKILAEYNSVLSIVQN
jgi:hypothetical protein